MKNITAFKDCTKCQFFEQIDKYNMHCKARDKKYMYGQTVPCEDFKKSDQKKGEKTDEH